MNIFVIGPYCSGASSAAQLVRSCGFYIGEPHELLPSTTENPLGTLEARWLVDFNDDLLLLFGADWHAATRLDVDTLPAFLRKQLSQRAATWAACMAQHGHWVCTDLRLCLTARFWLQVLPEALVVLCLRHPRDVVAAMLQRQPPLFAHPETALAAWRRSFLGAALDTASTPRFVLDYSRLMADPRGETARLVAFCRTHMPNYTPPPDVQEQMAHNLMPHLQHYVAENVPDVPCTSYDVEAYEALLADDQERLHRALQAFPVSSLAFDLNRVVHFHRHEIAARDQHIALLYEQSTAQKQGTHQRLIEPDCLHATRFTDKDRYMTTSEQYLGTLTGRSADTDQGLTVQLRDKERYIRSLEARLTILEVQLADKERLTAGYLADKDHHIANLEAQQHHLTLLQQLTAQEVRSLKRSWSYRVGRVLVWPGSLLKMVYRCLKQMHVIPSALPPTVVVAGETAAALAELRDKYQRLTTRPLFSILTPVYNTPASWLREALESVCNQVYQEWELCLVDDGSTRQETLDMLEEFRGRDPKRIKYARLPGNSGIAVASNTAARLATGTFLALLDHDDVLTPDALLEMALRLEQTPEADLLYSDEDKLTTAGEFVQPFYKPDFSPELLLSQNYLCHFSAIRTRVFWDVGGFREGVDGSQDFDLFLRVTEVARSVEHIPKILYHWRMVPGSTAADISAKGGPWHESSRQALRAAIARRHWQAEVTDGVLPDTYRVKFAVAPTEHVTIIIPTKDRVDFLQVCIESIRKHTIHPSYEILVISNNSEQEETYAYLECAMRDKILRFLRYDIPFNYAAINNFAVRHCESPYLLFLNNDTEVMNAEWLTSMLEFAQQKAIGAVGAKLLYPNGTIQHAGVVLGIGGVAGHSHRYMSEHSPGYFGHLNVIRNYSAVTAACLLTRREVFEAVGGFNEDLAVAFNDVDFCLEVCEAGYRIVYTPYTKLYHYESVSRGSDTTLENAGRFRTEIAYMLAKWGLRLQHDPYYNPNLTLCREDFSLKTSADVAEMQAFLHAFPSLGQSSYQRPSVPTTPRPLPILTKSARVVTAHEP
jgi:O-antigen biosynthesis protein